jgi:hypothetical protein
MKRIGLLIMVACLSATASLGLVGTAVGSSHDKHESKRQVTVAVSPSTASVATAATQDFTATVRDTSDKAVTWQVNGVNGGSSATGTISTSGAYTAPATVPSPATVTVTAISQANTSVSASATVTITGAAAPTPPSTPATISISPTSASVVTGAAQSFSATVQNSSNTAVTWQVNGVTGGNSTSGTISTSGGYTAPATVPSPATVTVTVIPAANTGTSASAVVTVTAAATPTPPAVTISISPTSASVATGGSQDFSATVQNSTNTAVTWQVNGVTGGNSATGTISTLGVYTAPTAVPSPATVTVTAVSQASSSVSASASVTITAAATTGTGASFYVSPSGSDSNPGTITAPWLTIQHAANSVQQGDTVFVRAGTYNESVTIAVSGSAAAGPVTFESYPGETAIVDGTGLTVSGSNTQGLFNIEDESYVTIEGFEIQNYTTSSADATPAGIWVTGSGSNIQILNNQVHNITTSSEKNGNAFGIAVYGSEAPASISNITISGNTVYDCKTGNSETVNVDGNVDGFTITSNIIHDNDNIGIDAIGFEGVSPDPTYDYARNGLIGENTVYNISAINNPGEGNQYDADGIYVDGGADIIIERNNVSTSDLNIEVASEHSGHYAINVTVRNNLVYFANSVGISIGGYSSGVGGTQNCTIVNNSLFEDDTKNTGSGEFQVQYYATNNVFENNIVYATSQGLFVNNYTNSEASPVAIDYNIYYSSVSMSSADFLWDGQNENGFAAYQTASGQDAHSQYANPDYVSLTTPNLDIQANSPAVGAGINLGSTIVGTVDYAGNPRVSAANTINIGAYQQ